MLNARNHDCLHTQRFTRPSFLAMSTNVQVDLKHLGYDIPRPVSMNGVVCPAPSIRRVCETGCENVDLASLRWEIER